MLTAMAPQPHGEGVRHGVRRFSARFLVPRDPIGRVALALFFVACAFALTLGLQRIGGSVYFILFVPAVMFSTWFGGLRAGMVASVLTVVATVYLLRRAELADQLAWLIVAAVVMFATSAMTEKRRRAEALLGEQAQQEETRRHDAETLSQLKSDVLLQVVHELRQPLSAMPVAIRLVGSAHDDTARQRALGVIGRQTGHLTRLVDDLLDAAKITRRELQLQKSTIDLCEVAEDSLGVIATDVAARRLDVSSSLPPCPVHVDADPTRIRQVLSNLLSNAVKFTPPGGRIDLIVERKRSDVVIRVRDTGQGIAPDRLDRVFEMFHKGEGVGAGLGIGLAIVKGLVEMHGGRVEARSEGPSHGSEFVVALPIAGYVTA